MTKTTKTKLVPHKSRALVILEYIILALCLCIMALRATFTEGPFVQSLDQQVNLGDSVYSLAISTVLIGLFAIWIIWSFAGRRVLYRPTSVEPGLCLFIIAAVIAGFGAANKRAAIDAALMLLAPILMMVMLVQILDSKARIKLVLVCIAALGVAGAYQCAEQFFYTNKMMIQQYQQHPSVLLGPLGIAPDTFNHMLFEHRLFSKGIHGYFTTSNSAGSFALLASFAAIVLFANVLSNRRTDGSLGARVLVGGVGTCFVVFGLLITVSKGAIIAFGVAAGMFAAYLLFGRWFGRNRKAVVVFCLLLALGGGGVVVAYGLENHTLPGGNSMLVRWQYWEGAWQMYVDNALTGVGPGNFVYHYPQYKAPGALETVTDPHNFLLSILTQYGPLGLLGFLCMILVPLRKVVFGEAGNVPKAGDLEQSSYKPIAWAFGVLICLALLVVRPMVLKIPADASFEEKQAAVVMLYVLVVVVFAVGFASFAFAGAAKGSAGGNVGVAGLFCAVVGLLLHNLIDFALFEPGVLMALAALLACLMAMGQYGRRRDYIGWDPSVAVRVGVITVAIAVVCGILAYGLIPAVRSVAKIRRAQRAVAYGRYDIARGLLNDAAGDDKLNPVISAMDAQICVAGYVAGGKADEEALVVAAGRLIEAVRRNRIDYKNFERLTEVYVLLAEAAGDARQKEYLERAFASAVGAVGLYPGSGRLAYVAGELAERLGHVEAAAEYYRQAVWIEDTYREQFRVMYPGKEVFSRLGEEKYEKAKQRAAVLIEK